jgi:hypothetical protein
MLRSDCVISDDFSRVFLHTASVSLLLFLDLSPPFDSSLLSAVCVLLLHSLAFVYIPYLHKLLVWISSLDRINTFSLQKLSAQELSAIEMSSVQELTALINDKAAHIKQLKVSSAPAEVITHHSFTYYTFPVLTQRYAIQEVQAQVKLLLDLKKQFQEANGGVPFDPPKAPEGDKKKATSSSAPAAEPEKAREGPSKKELNKMARKEKAANWKATAGSAEVPSLCISTRSE